jgi:hypothetical protein
MVQAGMEMARSADLTIDLLQFLSNVDEEGWQQYLADLNTATD